MSIDSLWFCSSPPWSSCQHVILPPIPAERWETKVWSVTDGYARGDGRFLNKGLDAYTDGWALN